MSKKNILVILFGLILLFINILIIVFIINNDIKIIGNVLDCFI